MSVRAASFGDNWRKVYERNYPESIRKISLKNSQTIDNTEIDLNKGITAIVGGNGVGKSTFAHAIAEGLLNSPGAPDLISQQERIYGTTISFEIIKNSANHIRRAFFMRGLKEIDGEETINCTWIDPSLFSTMCRQQILGDNAFEEVLEGITPEILSSDQLKLASYVVGKDYSACEVWEVSEYGPFETWPYFKVSTNNISYGSETMGQGELALLSALWTIQRAPRNSLVILEEPETHVSSRSQLALMDVLARNGSERGISFILTTHSPVILQRIPLANTYLLLANGARSRLLAPPRSHHISSLLGGGLSPKALLIVEDETAKSFCEAIIEHIDPDLARLIVYAVVKDGESEIVKILNTMPRIEGWGTLIGCFDGDQRTQYSTTEFPWPHVFLPGVHAPDLLLKNDFEHMDQNAIAQELRIDSQDLLVAVASAAGVDFHDWARRISGALHIEQSRFIKCVTKIWMINESVATHQLVSEIKVSLQSQ